MDDTKYAPPAEAYDLDRGRTVNLKAGTAFAYYRGGPSSFGRTCIIAGGRQYLVVTKHLDRLSELP